MSPNGKLLTYAEKLAQADREAKATAIALLATIVAWIVLGFGLAGFDIEIFHTPLWVVGGTIGTWIFALAVCVFLEKRVFVDFDLDDEPAAYAAAPGASFAAPNATQPVAASAGTATMNVGTTAAGASTVSNQGTEADHE